MWIPILIVCSLPVSGAVWGKKHVDGVVGRAITIDCHYEAAYRSHTKYWCQGWTHQCRVLLETNGQQGRSGRASITDNPTRGIFTVTVEDLRSGETGWYSCGITASGYDPLFNVYLQVSAEPVSVPVLGLLSPASVSCVGGSVTVSCKSERGSLPIRYTWYETTLKISNNNNLDLRCQYFKQQSHKYYCKASNNRGTESSEMVTVAVSNTGENCSYVVHFGNNAPVYSCATSTTEKMTSASSAFSNVASDRQKENSEVHSAKGLILIIVLSGTGVLLIVVFAFLLLYLRNRHRESKCNTQRRDRANGTQGIPTRRERAARVNLQHSRDDEAADQLANNDSGIMYAAVQFQRRSRMGQSVTNKDDVISQGKHSVTSEDNVTYANVNLPSRTRKGNARSPGNLQDSAQPIYASVVS
ncbi:uncharacterized protein LOC129708882 [Leucoraja erinacea]|uniref:uncharacterized protein LOC129708882 n=1 Tax=Leucoraja erinaceus TaxID=7782 RepID=UPI002454EE2C|nr:uncharacterized protein LOC129708882 [Leucoraja erinacea]